MSKVKKIAAKFPNLSNETKLQIALHINKSNLEHIEYLENKVMELEKKLKKNKLK